MKTMCALSLEYFVRNKTSSSHPKLITHVFILQRPDQIQNQNKYLMENDECIFVNKQQNSHIGAINWH